MNKIASTPAPPYYAVIFTSCKTDDLDGYQDMSNRMIELAKTQDGFLGVESSQDKIGITVSYWSSLDAIKKWKSNKEHKLAQEFGRKKWYSEFKTRIAHVISEN